MPHSTRASSATRIPNKFPNEIKHVARNSTEAFPVLDPGPYMNTTNGFVNSHSPLDRWHSRRDSSLQRSGGRGQNRQKSLSDAFRTIRNRKGSVSADIQECKGNPFLSLQILLPAAPTLVQSEQTAISSPETALSYNILTSPCSSGRCAQSSIILEAYSL
jgi:hypothetical protein